MPVNKRRGPVGHAGRASSRKVIEENSGGTNSTRRPNAQAGPVERISAASDRYRDEVHRLPTLSLDEVALAEKRHRPTIIVTHTRPRCECCGWICEKHAPNGTTLNEPPQPWYEAACGCAITFHVAPWKH